VRPPFDYELNTKSSVRIDLIPELALVANQRALVDRNFNCGQNFFGFGVKPTRAVLRPLASFNCFCVRHEHRIPNGSVTATQIALYFRNVLRLHDAREVFFGLEHWTPWQLT
jgi:hypothetical protein